MQARKIDHASHFENLKLEACPQSQQLMPPEASKREAPLALMVAGNVMVGILLLGGLLSLPAWLAGILGF